MNPKHKRTILRKVWRQLYFKEKHCKTIYRDGKVYIPRLSAYLYGDIVRPHWIEDVK